MGKFPETKNLTFLSILTLLLLPFLGISQYTDVIN